MRIPPLLKRRGKKSAEMGKGRKGQGNGNAREP